MPLIDFWMCPSSKNNLAVLHRPESKTVGIVTSVRASMKIAENRSYPCGLGGPGALAKVSFPAGIELYLHTIPCDTC